MVNKKQANEYTEVFHTAILILLRRLGNPLCNVYPAIKHLLTIIDRGPRSFVCAGITNKYRDIPRRTLSVFLIGRVMQVANRPERIFLRAFSKAGEKLAPLTLVLYLNVGVLD